MNFLVLIRFGLHWITLLSLIGEGTSFFYNTYNKKNVTKRSHVKAVPYIVNGFISQTYKYPFIVGIGGFKKNLFYIGCTGSILTSSWVLTAAHCLVNIKDPFVTAGSVQTFPNNLRNYFKISKSILHEKFNKNGKAEHDIAVVQVHEPLSLLKTTSVACLSDEDISYKEAIVAGFGLTYRNAISPPKRLREVVFQRRDDLCSLKYPFLFDSFRQTCAGLNGKGTCHGDSGAPLINFKDGQNLVIGVLSWADGCGEPNEPSVFTKLSYYISWIKQNIKETICIVTNLKNS